MDKPCTLRIGNSSPQPPANGKRWARTRQAPLVKALCLQLSCYILDELKSSFRWDLHSAMKGYDAESGLATFGQKITNDFALPALLGRKTTFGPWKHS